MNKRMTLIAGGTEDGRPSADGDDDNPWGPFDEEEEEMEDLDGPVSNSWCSL